MDPLATADITLVRADNPGPFTLEGTNSWLARPRSVLGRGPRARRSTPTSTGSPPTRRRAAASPASRSPTGTATTRTGSRVCSERVGEVAGRGVGVGGGDRAGWPTATPSARCARSPRPATRPTTSRSSPAARCSPGDAVLGHGSVYVAPDPGALRGYLAALDRLLALDLDVICPGHGPVVLRAPRQARRVPRPPPRPRAPARRGARRRAAHAGRAARPRLVRRAVGPAPRRGGDARGAPRQARGGGTASRRTWTAGRCRDTVTPEPDGSVRFTPPRPPPLRSDAPMAVETKVTFCRICEAALRHGGDGRGRAWSRSCGPTATTRCRQGYACPKGIAMTDVQNDPDRVTHPLRRDRATASFERGHAGRRRSPTSASACAASSPRTAATSVGWYLGNPGAFSYSHALWVKGFIDGARLAALLHGLLAGRRQPLRRQRAALRLAARCVPIPDLHRTDVPAHGRRQPARLARQRADRAADQGPAARRSSSAAGASSSSTRAAPRPRAHFEHVADPARHRRLAAALAAAACSSRRASPTRRRSRAQTTGCGGAARPGARRSRPRRRRRAPASPPTTVRALARDLAGADARRGLRAHRLLPRAASARSSRSCSTRSTLVDRQPRPRRRRACSGCPAIALDEVARAGRARHLRQGALAHRRLPRRARRAARRR